MRCMDSFYSCSGGRKSGSLQCAPAACTSACLHDAPVATGAPAARLLAGSPEPCSCRFAPAAGLPVPIAAGVVLPILRSASQFCRAASQMSQQLSVAAILCYSQELEATLGLDVDDQTRAVQQALYSSWACR